MRGLVWLTLAASCSRCRRRRPPLAALVRPADLPVRDRVARHHARDRERHRWRVALGLDPRAPVPVLGGDEDPPLAVVLAHYLASARLLASLRTMLGGSRHRHAAARPHPHPAGPGHSLVFGAIVFGALFSRRCEPALAHRRAPERARVHPGRLEPGAEGLPEDRLISFLDPTADPLGSGYQLQQSQITVGSGGLFGRGLTNGITGSQYLPVESTDFVFARVGEELGFLGRSARARARPCSSGASLSSAGDQTTLHTSLSRAASPGCCSSRWSSTSGWCWASCPSPASRSRSSTHGGASFISAGLGLGILESLAMRRSSQT